MQRLVSAAVAARNLATVPLDGVARDMQRTGGMSKINVNPDHYKVAGRGRQGEDILQERHRQKHARNLVRQRFEQTHAMAPSPMTAGRGALVPGPPPPGPTPTSTAKPAAQGAKAPRSPGATTARTKNAARTTKPGARSSAGVNKQAADKRGKRSTAQKRASSRHDFESMPATRPVAGAFGREPSRGGRKSKKR